MELYQVKNWLSSFAQLLLAVVYFYKKMFGKLGAVFVLTVYTLLIYLGVCHMINLVILIKAMI